MKPNLKLNIMYKVPSKQHYVIDWDKVETLEDLKKIVKAFGISFNTLSEQNEIKHLVKLEGRIIPPDKLDC